MWKEIWVIMLLLAFICLAGSILLVFLWDVPSLIDELSGRKAKRQIKMLHELNSSTSTFDKLSTNDIYSSISSGTLLNEELNNIGKDEVKGYDNSKPLEDIEEISTSFIGSEVEESTSYLGEGEEEATSYIEEEDFEESTSFLSTEEEVGSILENSNSSSPIITILEEQSSL